MPRIRNSLLAPVDLDPQRVTVRHSDDAATVTLGCGLVRWLGGRTVEVAGTRQRLAGDHVAVLVEPVRVASGVVLLRAALCLPLGVEVSAVLVGHRGTPVEAGRPGPHSP